jgi:hypothetical protein
MELPATAVTPIMKLLVAVDTLIGRFIAQSMATTFKAPPPMPRRPETTPAANIINSPSHHLTPQYSTSLPSTWS